ncbi:ABC transporter ATP-binding protein [uncultured Thiodictyon sp.]|uniref:ABC transporter ATP-binding protein n=1 Tax=uncultured Thiodictyon sp. TaxID=1846217 RepID=UPI0025E52D88|nr:ABC transporter ATP-binding protein [uncultured Thiodictyon sp.]
MLSLERVSKVYRVGTFGGGQVRAVSELSFALAPGEVVALIGESGSGKSTVGRMVLNLLPVSTGSIRFDGIALSDLRQGDRKDYWRRVQGVFQDPFSAYNPIFKADRIFRTLRAEFFPRVETGDWNRRLDGALQAVGLNPQQVRDKFPHQLSGGQLQRLLIARALLLDVQLLVADEIISMLDASTRVDVLNLLADLKARGMAILFITHDLGLANYLSDRVIVLYRGCMVEAGPAEAVFENPQHPYTRMLVAATPRLDCKWPVSDWTPPVGEGEGLGCVYSARCPLCDGQCNRPPVPIETAAGHRVACWRVADPGH